VFTDIPWQPLTKPIGQCKVSLVTTAGVHLVNQPGFNMADRNGDHSFREIPADTGKELLKITHNYYDHRDADEDVNTVFPIDHLRYLQQTEEIGTVNRRHFSFMGHIINNRLDLLLQESAPEVARLLKEDGVDAVILSPA
jgi:D-proline reductase (dithiol) PrdB